MPGSHQRCLTAGARASTRTRGRGLGYGRVGPLEQGARLSALLVQRDAPLSVPLPG